VKGKSKTAEVTV